MKCRLYFYHVVSKIKECKEIKIPEPRKVLSSKKKICEYNFQYKGRNFDASAIMSGHAHAINSTTITWLGDDERWILIGLVTVINFRWRSTCKVAVERFQLTRIFSCWEPILEAYSEPSQTSKNELLAKIMNGWKPQIIFCKKLYIRCLIGFWIRLCILLSTTADN